MNSILTRGPIGWFRRLLRVGWFRRLLRVVASYDRDLSTIAQHVQGVEKETERVLRYMRRATKVHFDVDIEAQSTVIVVGQYRGRDHVQVFNIDPGNFEALVDQMKDIRGKATLGRLDLPPRVDATVKRALDR